MRICESTLVCLVNACVLVFLCVCVCVCVCARARARAHGRLFWASICDFVLYQNQCIGFNYSFQNGCFLYDDDDDEDDYDDMNKKKKKNQQEQQHQQG